MKEYSLSDLKRMRSYSELSTLEKAALEGSWETVLVGSEPSAAELRMWLRYQATRDQAPSQAPSSNRNLRTGWQTLAPKGPLRLGASTNTGAFSTAPKQAAPSSNSGSPVDNRDPKRLTLLQAQAQAKGLFIQSLADGAAKFFGISTDALRAGGSGRFVGTEFGLDGLLGNKQDPSGVIGHGLPAFGSWRSMDVDQLGYEPNRQRKIGDVGDTYYEVFDHGPTLQVLQFDDGELVRDQDVKKSVWPVEDSDYDFSDNVSDVSAAVTPFGDSNLVNPNNTIWHGTPGQKLGSWSSVDGTHYPDRNGGGTMNTRHYGDSPLEKLRREADNADIALGVAERELQEMEDINREATSYGKEPPFNPEAVVDKRREVAEAREKSRVAAAAYDKARREERAKERASRELPEGSVTMPPAEPLKDNPRLGLPFVPLIDAETPLRRDQARRRKDLMSHRGPVDPFLANIAEGYVQEGTGTSRLPPRNLPVDPGRLGARNPRDESMASALSGGVKRPNLVSNYAGDSVVPRAIEPGVRVERRGPSLTLSNQTPIRGPKRPLG